MKSKTMKLLALVLTVIMVFMLAGCEVSTSSSSTTTVTTSTTDENGNTTTTTTTTEVGGSAGTDGVTTTNTTTTETTTTPAADAAETAEEDPGAKLREHLVSTYKSGAEGTNEAGDHFYYAYNEDDGNDDTLLVIVSADESSYNGWEGTSTVVDDHVVLTSDDNEVPYTFEETDGGFIMTFLNDGDVATMQFVDVETVADDVVAARLMFAD